MDQDDTEEMFREALRERNTRGRTFGRNKAALQLTRDPLPFEMKRVRGEMNLSQRKLAEIVGCSGVFISKIESGQKYPKANLLAKIQEVLRLDNEVVRLHVFTRPYQFQTRSSAKGQLITRTSGGSFDEVTIHEKAIQLMLAAGAALRSNGYDAQPRLPSGHEQIMGVLPWIEVALGEGAKGIIKIEVKDDRKVV